MEQQTLAEGSVLRSSNYSYRINKVLGQGSFGITYLATTRVKMQGPLGTLETEMKVAIKEFFMRDVNQRERTGEVTASSEGSLSHRYARKFKSEAENLSRLHHEGIVHVVDIFDANHTEYYVMEYVEGSSLDDYIVKQGALPEQEALKAVESLGDALQYMHAQNMLHLDLKPKNVMRRAADGRLLLIDFGLSKQYDEQGEPESSTTIGGGTPGYAPLEQSTLHEGRDFLPTLDIYALGATLYKMLTGNTPPLAAEVLNDGLSTDVLREHGVSERTIQAVECAMSPQKKRRPQSVEAFLQMMQLGTKHYEKEKGPDEEVKSKSVEKSNEETVATMSNPTKSLDEKTVVVGMQEPIMTADGIEEFTVNGVSFKMVKVDGGTFQMGYTFEEKQANGWKHFKQLFSVNDFDSDEKPVHSVTLSGYYIGQTEVTQALWETVIGENPSHFKGLRRPVECVSWDDCQKFISKLNSLTGKHFRLPTEAEWEFAARGGNNSCGYKYSGGNNLDDVAWYTGNSGYGTHDVGTKLANELGLYDMNGNVWEWCSDWYGSYDSGSQTNPRGAESGSYRVDRGGSWNCEAEYCRVSNRYDKTPGNRSNGMGLRLALSVQ